MGISRQRCAFYSSSSLHSFSRLLPSMASIRSDYFLLLPFVHPNPADPSLPGILRLCRPLDLSLRHAQRNARLGVSTSYLAVYSGGVHTHSLLDPSVPSDVYTFQQSTHVMGFLEVRTISLSDSILPLGLSSPVVRNLPFLFPCYLVSSSASASYFHAVILTPHSLDIMGLNALSSTRQVD